MDVRKVILLAAFLLTVALVRAEAPDEQQAPEPDQQQDGKKSLARGWGDSIEWRALEEGLAVAKSEKKPLLLLIHKTWCGACKSLKSKFAKAKMIAELSKSFVMVNVEDDEEPWEEEYYPDGGKYIPRILFVSPEGHVLKDVKNPKNEYAQYPYYYSNPAPIIHAMKNVLEKYGIPLPGLDEADADGKAKESADKSKESEGQAPAAQPPAKEL